MLPTLNDLFEATLKARQRVYELAPRTPIQKLIIDGDFDGELYIKREDLSPINAYKWRGSYNRMCQLSEDELLTGVVCASAGNHAQGVALSAEKLGTHATIFMPKSTPLMKISSVRNLGGNSVTVRLEGNSYDEAYALALENAQTSGKTFIHAYDDLQVIAGQATLADEVVMSGIRHFDRVYLQIGGGGMAAGVASWLKRYYPMIEVVGVEGVDQASMLAATQNGSPLELDYVDVFCDGTAVKKVGTITHHFCSQLIDRFVTVTNEEVCSAIQTLWEGKRLIPEPAGAMGLAAYKKEIQLNKGKRSLVIICGSNMDFGQLSWVVKHAGIGSARRKYYRFFLEERPGSLLDLINDFPNDVNIVEFQHGVVPGKTAAPVIGLDATAMEFAALEQHVTKLGIKFEEATNDEDVEFRIIHYDSSLFKHPIFIRIEFHERPGALSEFLSKSCALASIIYFNYGYTGERVGRALIGFDFNSIEERENFVKNVLEKNTSLRHAKELNSKTIERVIGKSQ